MQDVGNIIVTPNKDLPSYPYTIQRVNTWGISDGTLVEENTYANNDNYELVEQQNGANVYKPKQQ